MSSGPMELGTVGALTLSVASSVSIVIVNKYLISTLGYRYVTFLTALHMLVTVGALRVAAIKAFPALCAALPGAPSPSQWLAHHPTLAQLPLPLPAKLQRMPAPPGATRAA